MIIVTEKHISSIREAIKSYSGVILERLQRSRVEKKIIEQMNQLNCQNINDYIELLENYENNSETMDNLISSTTVNESYIFRNPKQFEYLIDSFFPEFFQKRGVTCPMRIWSAGCSRGEEAYSIAMIAKHYQKKHPDSKFTINAGDISKQNLLVAKSGVYPQNSLRGEKENFEEKLGFTLVKSDSKDNYVISEELKSMVDFLWLNLKDTNKLKIMRGSDIIFCRNVLIYFDEQLRNQLIQTFYEFLNPGGLLFIGESECFPFPASTFIVQNNNNGSYAYRKPEKN